MGLIDDAMDPDALSGATAPGMTLTELAAWEAGRASTRPVPPGGVERYACSHPELVTRWEVHVHLDLRVVTVAAEVSCSCCGDGFEPFASARIPILPTSDVRWCGVIEDGAQSGGNVEQQRQPGRVHHRGDQRGQECDGGT